MVRPQEGNVPRSLTHAVSGGGTVTGEIRIVSVKATWQNADLLTKSLGGYSFTNTEHENILGH